MGDVIELDSRRPHSTGEARCVICGHEFVAVVPPGVCWFECPECHLHRATFVYELVPHSDQIVCAECDCETFTLHIDGGCIFALCQRCGNVLDDLAEY